MVSGRVAVITGILVALVAAGSLGTYVILNFPQQTVKVVEPISVYKNQILLFGSYGTTPFQYGPFVGIWQLEVGNNGQTPIYLEAGLYVNGVPTGIFNNTELTPGQSINVTDCVSYPRPPVPVVVKIFGTSQTGVVTPEYPVTLVNATKVPFSNQFSASSQLRLTLQNQSFGIYTAEWNVSVTNKGTKPIIYLGATLANDTAWLAAYGLRCLGGTYFANVYTAYDQPLLPGQTQTGPFLPNIKFQIMRGHSFQPGESYVVTIAAGYSDNSVVTQTFNVTAT